MGNSEAETLKGGGTKSKEYINQQKSDMYSFF
jgi:hypothetical protein